jgi:LmbE family N-acetylglucosaminyl deacetylase
MNGALPASGELPMSGALPRMLFVFPHPDDESFLTGGTIARYALSGAAHVVLYTLTRGESSRNASTLGITPDAIAAMRVEEVRAAARILGVGEFLQGSYPDGGLRDMDPRILEEDLRRLLRRVVPDVVVTFDVQGGSVHPDHITAHHAVKRVFVEERGRGLALRRLAFCGQPNDRTARWPRKVFGFPPERIHAIVPVAAWAQAERDAIAAHRSVRRDVEEHNYDEWMFWEEEFYSFFQERPPAPLDDLLAGLPDPPAAR